MLYVRSITYLSVLLIVTSCTGGGGQNSAPSKSPGDFLSDSPTSPTVPGVSPSAPTQITAEKAQDLVKQVQIDMAANPQYALTNQDLDELTTEALVGADELKGWVK